MNTSLLGDRENLLMAELPDRDDPVCSPKVPVIVPVAVADRCQSQDLSLTTVHRWYNGCALDGPGTRGGIGWRLRDRAQATLSM